MFMPSFLHGITMVSVSCSMYINKKPSRKLEGFDIKLLLTNS
jgi:hypothetical protein